MSDEVRAILQPTAADLGAPVKVNGNLLGRITQLMGDPLDGHYPRIRFSTPHGSILDGMGIVWARLQRLNEAELDRLRELEQHSRETLPAGEKLYRGEITLDR